MKRCLDVGMLPGSKFFLRDPLIINALFNIHLERQCVGSTPSINKIYFRKSRRFWRHTSYSPVDYLAKFAFCDKSEEFIT